MKCGSFIAFLLSAEEIPDLPERAHEMPTRMFTPAGGLSNALRDMLTDRPAVSKYHSFLKGFQMHNEYTQNQQFSKWKGIAIFSLGDVCGHLNFQKQKLSYLHI